MRGVFVDTYSCFQLMCDSCIFLLLTCISKLQGLFVFCVKYFCVFVFQRDVVSDLDSLVQLTNSLLSNKNTRPCVVFVDAINQVQCKLRLTPPSPPHPAAVIMTTTTTTNKLY